MKFLLEVIPLYGIHNRHVSCVSFVGLRVREQELLALGISLPGLGNRRGAVAELPALGLLTLAGMMSPDWTCSYHEVDVWEEALIDQIAGERPCLVAVSALTASVEEAYSFCEALYLFAHYRPPLKSSDEALLNQYSDGSTSTRERQ